MLFDVADARISLSELNTGMADFALLDPATAIEPVPVIIDIDPLAPAAAFALASARVGEAAVPVLGIIDAALDDGHMTPALRSFVGRLDAVFAPGGSLQVSVDVPNPILDVQVSSPAVPPADIPGLILVKNPQDALDLTVKGLREFPQSGSVFAQALRGSSGLGVRGALDMESLAYSTLLGGAEFSRWLRSRGPRPLPPRALQEPVLVERRGNTLDLTLNRPERRNAYGVEVRDRLVSGLLTAVTDPSIDSIVLQGRGPSFCAGGDLDEFGTAPDLATAHLIRTRAGAAYLLSCVAERTVARVHGACVGAGIEIPALAGHVVADPHTTFRLPEVAMGLIPGAGGTTSLPRRIGRWWTFVICTTGMAVTAQAALALGLIDEIDDVAG